MKMSIKLSGGDRVGRGLKAMARPEELEALKLQALIAAGAPLRDEAKLEAPFDEGRLFSAIELETRQPMPRRKPERTGVAVWVKYTKDYRPLKSAVKEKGKRGRKAYMRTYQIGSIPSVYGGWLEFGSEKIKPPQPWMAKAWDKAGGQTAVRLIDRVLGRGLVKVVKRRFTGR